MSLVLRAAVLVVFPNDHAAYLLTPCRLDGLAAGAFVALALRDREDWRRLIGWAPLIALAAGGFILGMGAGQRHLLDNIDFKGQSLPGVDSSVLLCIGLTALALLFGSVVALVVHTATQPSRPLQYVFRNRILRSLGIYSYAMYVFHPLVISLARYGMAEMGFTWPQNALAAFACRVVVIPVVLLMSYTLALLSYHAYEKHFLALKRFFPSARQSSRVSAVPAIAHRSESNVGRIASAQI
jgi:peptidoglycan/LPS O-acetylase OafA/YrhL